MDNVCKSGFLLINKPIGMSSYGCIGHIKRILRPSFVKTSADFQQGYGGQVRQKIGHAGTLDPFASGLLIVAIGREATRLLSQIMGMEKTYLATGKCGELTDTLDCTGAVVATTEVIPTEQALYNSLESFGSSYEQIPPLYSALKHQGKPMYLLVRNKMMTEEQLQEVADAKRRTIQLYDKQFLSYNPPFFTIQVKVSQGTYIRTLINDIAVRAGSYATTHQLARVAIGPFDLSRAVDLASLTTIDDINKCIVSVDHFLLMK
jgi:tRNA pseudouridine55 synthase